MKKFTRIVLLGLIAVIMAGSLSVQAKSVKFSAYGSYEINNDGNSVSAPIGFVEETVCDSRSLKLKTNLNSPQDFISFEKGFYILDSGNGRIIETDHNLKFVSIIDKFKSKDGKTIDITNAKGFDLSPAGDFVIADTDNERIVIVGKDGLLKKEIYRPDAVLEDKTTPFQVSKVKCAVSGDIYVTVQSMNKGIFVFDSDGKFDKFVANNPVVKTADVLLDYAYRMFLTTQQIRNRLQNSPLLVTNFCIDKERFIYTVSQNAESTKQTGMVRRLNYTDTNIIDSRVIFGDVEKGESSKAGTLFQSIDITDEGNIVLLDSGRGKVFYYSENGYLISVFGGYGDQSGTFISPVEVRCVGDCIYVLDAARGTVIKFRPTEYITKFKSALNLLKERKFDESLDKWKEINLLNSNSEYAYYGMGLVYDLKKDYASAMRCFKLANNKEAYSNSYKEYRMIYLSAHVKEIIIAIIILIALIVALKILIKKKKKTTDNESAYGKLEKKSTFPLYVLRHPIDGCEQFRVRDVMSIPIAAGIVVAWFAVEILAKNATGFIFAGSSSFNPVAVFVSTVGLFFLYVTANWCAASFLEGKGFFKAILVATAYSLIPYIVSKLGYVAFSNVLTASEAVFISLIVSIGLIWSGFLLIASMYAIHEYTFTRNMVSMLITLIGMIIIVFVLIIFYSLLQQAYGFLQSLYQEISL